MSRSKLKTLAIVWLLLASFAWLARAAEVSANLSQNTVGLGEAIQFLVKISGASGNVSPPDVAVDGLNIRYMGPSQSTSMRIINGQTTIESNIIHVYTVQPRREGSFTIPALAVEVDGRSFRTQPVALKVEKAGTNAGGESRVPGDLEVIVPRKTAYVGEMLPVEVRLSVDSRVRWGPQAMPDLSGEGFTKQKMPEPRQEHGRKDGREVDVLVFRTAITPSKAGRITLGPVEVPYEALVPRPQRQRRGSMFDLDSVFGDQFFSERQQFRARAEAVEIEVKPLPAAGRPAAFSGAVGQFKFAAEGSPRQVKMGDPVTMKLTVSGRGNFDRIEAPALTDSNGWRAYPPSANFKADDELSLGGTKTFEMAVIPEAKKTTMPVFEFSYFDPELAKYVTLKSESRPLTVEGGAPPPPPPVVSSASQFGAPAATPAPRDVTDIFGVRYDAGHGVATFEPLYARRGFLLAQLVPLVVLLALLGWRFSRSDVNAGRLSALRREKATLLARLHRKDLAEADFLDTAARVLQLETALATGREPGSVDAVAVGSVVKLDEESARVVEQIFSARAELLFAGGGSNGGQLSAADRQSVLATLDKLSKSHAHG